MSFKITQDWTVEKEASGGDEDMLRFLQVESLESLKLHRGSHGVKRLP